MINIATEITQRLISESRRKQYIFNDDSMTFKDLRDIFSNIFGKKIVKINRHVPMHSLYITNKDGQFFMSNVDKPTKLLSIKDTSLMKECEDEEYASKTIASIENAVSAMDDVKLMNRFFANGKNLAKFSFIAPPNNDGKFYDGKNFLTFDGIFCIGKDKNKKLEEDVKTGKEFLKTFNSICKKDIDDAILNKKAYCRFCSEKNVLNEILKKLSSMIDGLGWNSSIKDYLQDRYARFIINKALQHGIDVSKNGPFARELCSRLCGTSSLIPTKSDLSTFAKREHINCNSPEYKTFIEDLENQALTLRNDIISPIEKTISFAISKAIDDIIGFMLFDPNPRTQKLANILLKAFPVNSGSIEDCYIDVDNLQSFKKNARKTIECCNDLPKDICIFVNGKPVLLQQDFSSLESLIGIME